MSAAATIFFYDNVASPVGDLIVVTNATHLVALEFGDLKSRMTDYLSAFNDDFRLEKVANPLNISARLEAYLAGDLAAIDSIEVEAHGTDFQRSVWRELRLIPSGETTSYGQLAKRIGQASASRAVGMANSKNPIGIVVPCHRVIGANGKLTGYAGGVERKQWLLQHERVSGQLNLKI